MVLIRYACWVVTCRQKQLYLPQVALGNHGHQLSCMGSGPAPWSTFLLKLHHTQQFLSSFLIALLCTFLCYIMTYFYCIISQFVHLLLKSVVFLCRPPFQKQREALRRSLLLTSHNVKPDLKKQPVTCEYISTVHTITLTF